MHALYLSCHSFPIGVSLTICLAQYFTLFLMQSVKHYLSKICNKNEQHKNLRVVSI